MHGVELRVDQPSFSHYDPGSSLYGDSDLYCDNLLDPYGWSYNEYHPVSSKLNANAPEFVLPREASASCGESEEESSRGGDVSVKEVAPDEVSSLVHPSSPVHCSSPRRVSSPVTVSSPIRVSSPVHSVSPKSVSPKSVSPKSVSPKSVSPKSVSPKSVSPKSVSPKSISPKSISPKSVSPAIVSPTDISPHTSESPKRDISPAPSPDRSQSSPIRNHQSINHPSINHQSINHQSINHQSINHQSINHQSINHQSINHQSINQSTNHPPTNQPLNHPPTKNTHITHTPAKSKPRHADKPKKKRLRTKQRIAPDPSPIPDTTTLPAEPHSLWYFLGSVAYVLSHAILEGSSGVDHAL